MAVGLAAARPTASDAHTIGKPDGETCMGGTIELSIHPDFIDTDKYKHIRLPSDLIDLNRFDHITNPSPEDYEAIEAENRKLKVELKVKEILSPLLQPFQDKNDRNECIRNVAREFYAFLDNIEGVEPDIFAERYAIGLAVLGRYWPAAYEKSITHLARYFFNDLKSSPEYGYACVIALTAEEQRLKEGNFFPLGNGRHLTGIGQLVAAYAKYAIQSATKADEQIRPAVRWILDDFILKKMGGIQLPGFESLPAEILQDIKRLREEVPDKDIPMQVVNNLITPNWEYVQALYLVKPLATILGVEAYCEAAALAFCIFNKQFDSTETAELVRTTYIARRLGAAYTTEGKAYTLATIQAKRFLGTKFSLSDLDRELAEDEFIDTFRRVFTTLPVESLLSPDLFFGYTQRSARNAVNKWLSNKNNHVSIDAAGIELWIEPSDDELVFVEVKQPTEEDTILPESVKLIPDYITYLRWDNGNGEASLKDLAIEQDISREGMRKRLKRFESNAETILRLEEAADGAGWSPISTEVWAQIKPLIPKARNRDHYIMRGIAFRMSKGVSWSSLPKSETFRRYYTKWLQEGVFDRMHQAGIDLW